MLKCIFNYSLRHRVCIPILFIAMFALGIVCCCFVFFLPCLFPQPTDRLTAIIAILTMIGGFGSFLYARHAQETQLFREIFREFNERYDKLNEQLNEIKNRPKDEPLKRSRLDNAMKDNEQPSKRSDQDVLMDYFNLCAEEYMYAKSGYIDTRVWHAWCKGMKYFASDEEINELWREELKQGSYYGFSLDEIKKH